MIHHLQSSKDRLINNINKNDINEITSKNAYHSLEISETDEEAEANKNKIVTYDLQWRSDTVSEIFICLV